MEKSINNLKILHHITDATEPEYQAQKYDQYSQDMARDQDELANTQYAYEQQKSEYENLPQSSIEGRWDSDELQLEPQSTSGQEIHHEETAMEKIAKIQEETERYQQKMDQMKKLEEEIFEESRRIK